MENEQNAQQNGSNSKNVGLFIGLIIIAAVALVIFFAFGANDNNEANLPENNQNQTENTGGSTQNGEIKTFNVTGRPFSFSPAEIRVNRGDRVKIVFTNELGVHDWVLDEFSARTPVIQAGQTAEVEFVADQLGEFEYYCSVMDHRARGMVGKLIVE